MFVKKRSILNIYYIKDRKRVGLVCENFDEVKKALNKLNKKGFFTKRSSA